MWISSRMSFNGAATPENPGARAFFQAVKFFSWRGGGVSAMNGSRKEGARATGREGPMHRIVPAGFFIFLSASAPARFP